MSLICPSSLGDAESLIGRPMSALSLSKNHRIVIGVDFGTTYTGVSYIDSSTSKEYCSIRDVHDVRTWPGPGKAGAIWKTPSRIAYSSENSGITANQFGYQVTPKMKSYSWTKLLLDRKSRPTEFDDPSLKRTEGEGMLNLPGGKTAEEVVTDFLREIYRWTVDQLAKRISHEVLLVTPLEFWFTVPAIWSDRAKSATMSAARDAGFASRDADTIHLIPEPEAAGVATLKGLSEGSSAPRINPGESILICDCGGGTVDITSYKVVRVTPKLEFEELVGGNGGKCGSTYIDRAFHKWMSETFGSAFEELSFEKTGPGSRLMSQFESRKHDFGYSRNLDQELEREYELDLVMHGATDSTHYNSEESVVKFSGHVMVQLFDPVIATILALLGQQIRAVNGKHPQDTLKRVILVGGFGDSPYLFHRVKEWCENIGLTVLCPEDPQAAIARGAALRGLECVVPIKRRSRRHYGLACDIPFEEGVDPVKSGYFCEWTNEKYCSDRIDWAVAKANMGDVIDETTRIVMEMYGTYIEGEHLARSATLYSSSADVAPRYASDPAAEKVATLTHTFDPNDLKDCLSKRVDGKLRWRVAYENEVHMGTKEGTLSFTVVRNDKTWGKTEIAFDGKKASSRRSRVQ